MELSFTTSGLQSLIYVHTTNSVLCNSYHWRLLHGINRHTNSRGYLYLLSESGSINEMKHRESTTSCLKAADLMTWNILTE